MKKHTTTLIILLFAAAAYGQKVEFEYDRAGNRVLREYIVPPSLNWNDNDSEHPDENDRVKNDEVKEAKDKTVVFPNPTRGKVTVMLGSAYTEGQLSTVKILDANGREIQSVLSSDQSIPISLSGLQQGVYTLQLTTHENLSYHWKVVLLN